MFYLWFLLFLFFSFFGRDECLSTLPSIPSNFNASSLKMKLVTTTVSECPLDATLSWGRVQTTVLRRSKAISTSGAYHIESTRIPDIFVDIAFHLPSEIILATPGFHCMSSCGGGRGVIRKRDSSGAENGFAP